ncbi:MAG: hypothetical protein NTV28_05785 [Propionibacteriales bacterium]|nr:hypothetical protein [Propionibacteriales bacterium]
MTTLTCLRADLVTLLRSRAVRFTVVGATALAALLTGSLVATSGGADAAVDVSTTFGQVETLIDPITGLVVAAMLAAYWGSGFGDGSILWSFLAARSRAVIALSALATGALLGLTAAAAASVTKVLTLSIALGGREALWWGDDRAVLALGGALVAGVALGVAATAVSLVVRHGAVAVGLLFGWLLLVEPLVARLLPESTWTWFPGQALAAVRNAVERADTGHALAVVTVSTLLLAAASVLVTVRRDP